MLDIKMIRENPELVEENLKKRGDKKKTEMLEELIKKDKKRRDLIKEVEELKRQRNVITKEISELKAAGKDTKKKIQEAADIPKEIKEKEEELEKLTERCDAILMKLPNLLHDSVPFGKDDTENKEVRRWGEPPRFSFAPKNHFDILQDLGLIDAERAAKVSGTGFFYFKSDLALLDFALMRYTMDFMIKRGYTLIEPPFMIRRKPYEGVTDLEFFHDQLYKIEGEDLYLIATSEHPMAAMFMDEVLLKHNLPIKFVGISPCFRKEVGSHGKYTKGMFRMHQFNKIEQFIFCLPEDSYKYHEEVQKNSEDIYQSLGLPHRVVDVCTGDIGDIASKKYDTEIWMVDGQYRESGSNSNCTDYQARRLNIKFREKEGAPPLGFVHTINNTAIATSRTIMAILEVFQQKDGTVKVPKVLVPYMGKEVIERTKSF